ncbi:MAG: SprB repeat-containing protein, partial [Thermoanaerobaculia bacterium]|nr:SprB repeat-containing protein [Thermoanaerobaculia bacterium]
ISATSISCAGRKDGRLELTLQAGTLPVNFQWINLNDNAQGVGQFAALNQPLLLAGLPPGLYRFTFADALGATATSQVPIAEPPPLQAEFLLL